MTLRSEETALRGQLRRLPRRGKGGAADRGVALHEVEFPIKRKPGQTCASLRPGRLPYNDRPGRPRAPMAAGVGPLHTTMKRPSAASSPAFPARAVKAALFGRAPHRPPRAAARPPGGPVRGASGPHLMPRPWRGRAPPLPPSAPRPAQTTAALQEIRKGQAYTQVCLFCGPEAAIRRGIPRSAEPGNLEAIIYILS